MGTWTVQKVATVKVKTQSFIECSTGKTQCTLVWYAD